MDVDIRELYLEDLGGQGGWVDEDGRTWYWDPGTGLMQIPDWGKFDPQGGPPLLPDDPELAADILDRHLGQWSDDWDEYGDPGGGDDTPGGGEDEDDTPGGGGGFGP